MKSVSTALKTHLQADCTTLARLYKITRKDGTIYTFTDHDRDIDTTGYQAYLTDGSVSPLLGYVYLAVAGFSPTAVENKSDYSVDNQEATVFINDVSIKETDLRYGLWDSAIVEIRLVNWADLTQGEVRLRYGMLGNISMKNGVLTAEVLGLTNKLQILLGRTFGTPCDAELGDSRCQAIVPVETGYVGSSSDAHHITVEAGGSPLVSLTGAAGYYSNLGAGTFVVNNSSGVTIAESGSGVIAATGTDLNITAAELIGSQTTYTFSLTGGPPPQAGENIVISGMADAGNNGTFTLGVITPLSAAEGGAVSWVTGYYDNGILTFDSGLNAGLSYQIAQWDGSTLTLNNVLFAAPVPGDSFSISPGCGHNVFDCLNKFNNLANHRGFPMIPGMDSLLNYPNAVSS